MMDHGISKIPFPVGAKFMVARKARISNVDIRLQQAILKRMVKGMWPDQSLKNSFGKPQLPPQL